MMMGKIISRAALCIVLGVALVALLQSTVDAATFVRERPSRKIRGSGRHLGIGGIGTEGNNHKETPKDKTTRNTPSRNAPSLKSIVRPAPKSFDDLNVKGSIKTKPKQELAQPEVTEVLVSTKAPGNVETTDAVETGAEHFKQVEVEVYRRELPSLSIQFNIEDSSSSKSPNLADYNELSDVSEEYLHGFLTSAFEDVPVRHDGTVLFVAVKDDDPFTVDFTLTLEFIIPGEVPTINFLLDKLREGLETETSQLFFISKLEEMSETNPFSGTDSYEVVSRPPMSVAELAVGGGGNNPQTDIIENKSKSNVLVSLLAGMGCVVFVGVGVLWKKTTSNQSGPSVSDQTFSLFDKSNKNDKSRSGSTGPYGADEETMTYLKSLRKRYTDRDEMEVSVSRESNIAAVEQTGSYDDEEDSMCDTVESGSAHRRNDIVDVEI
eukprot:CAMPEP_0168227256 /NCGR_PEP_ID=MMETSP0140_2-20121125/13921_1 /TAXON_ID=44445 /ORGANISM="Pseudo-nitzschia australis, Strain 10249 10 AB" /LENGTH=435 /DNA_ID=CAMNT_0008158541 /DNA_START=23 /DNA_END=1330 /DNA_ORIENTATION=-